MRNDIARTDVTGRSGSGFLAMREAEQKCGADEITNPHGNRWKEGAGKTRQEESKKREIFLCVRWRSGRCPHDARGGVLDGCEMSVVGRYLKRLVDSGVIASSTAIYWKND